MSFAAAASGLRTVRDLLRFAVTRFGAAGLSYGHGTDNAYDEAAYLVLHTLHLPLDRLDPFLDAALLHEEVEGVLSVLERRVTQRIPAPYLTHEAWLRGYRFYVDERVIVPRSHIAELIEGGFTTWLTDETSMNRTLDLCTGSGCLAVMLASRFPHAQVDAVDICADALAVARRNIADYHLCERVHPVQSDLYSALQGHRYELIVSNPPYVTHAAMKALPAEYLHEPARALAAGADGLDIVRRIVAESRAHLMPGGILVMEVGSGRGAFEQAFAALEPIWLETSAGGDQVFVLEREQLPG
jgi:ribosomal protein L3 glutamine methyltransferase